MSTADRPTDEQVVAAIKGLPFRLRVVFVMRHVQRKAPATIAAELGLSEHQVERRLTRALVVCRRNVERQEVKRCDSQS